MGDVVEIDDHSSGADLSAMNDKENAMGIQSQCRKKSTTKTKARPNYIIASNKSKKVEKQTFIFGNKPPENSFIPKEHCAICRAKHYGLAASHRQHHLRCPSKRGNNGRALTEREAKQAEEDKRRIAALNRPLPKTTAQQKLEKVERDRVNALRAPITTEEAPGTCHDKNRIIDFISGKKMNINKGTRFVTTNKDSDNSNHQIILTDSNINNNNNTNGVEIKKFMPYDATKLREYVDSMMKLEKDMSSRKLHGCPKTIIAVTKYVRDNCVPPRMKTDSNEMIDSPQSSVAMENYRMLFPEGNMEYSIPKESKSVIPSPFYHSIESHKILWVQWELNYPDINLGCTTDSCDGTLIHDRTNFSKDGVLFPIYECGQPHIWAVVMSYCCNKCNKRVNGNDGELLVQLPSHIRDAYPVHPRYAFGNFHLSKATSESLEHVIVTYGNGEYFSKSLYQRMYSLYVRNTNNYYSQCSYLQKKFGNCEIIKYPNFNEFIGVYYPDGAKFRELYEKAQISILTDCGYSEMDRYTREIQSVECSLTIAQDHTMEVVKNYMRTQVDAKAVWTCCNEYGEIAAAVLVRDTKSSQYAHAAEQLARRPNFKPKVMYADTWPHLVSFWKLIFGSTCEGRLGLFHFFQRIVKTLRDSHCDCKLAISDLLKCIYEHDQQDLLQLMHVLKNGLMAKDGHKYTDVEILEMTRTGLFKKRYDKWLRKLIYPPPKIRDNLNSWWIKYKVKGSDGKPEGRGRLDPKTRKKVFTYETKEAFENALISCEYISDSLAIDEIYTTLSPTPHSTHNLREHMSHRVESRLEGFHDPLSNFGNSGMSKNLADILHLAGTARYNANIREKIMSQKMSIDERKQVPAHYLNIPKYFNHAELDIINKNASKVGIETPPFVNLRIPKEDNGERFFSQYLFQQKERNDKVTPHINNDRCQCILCANNEVPLYHEKAVPTIMNENPKDVITKFQEVVRVPKKRRKVRDEKPVMSEQISDHRENPFLPSMLPSVYNMSNQFSGMIPPIPFNNYYGAFIPPYPQQAGPNNIFPPPPHFAMMQQQQPQQLMKRKLQKEYCCYKYCEYINSERRCGRPPHCPVTCKNPMNLRVVFP